MVNDIVDYQEPVVGILQNFHGDWWILAIVFFKIKFELLGKLQCVDCGLYSALPLVKHREDRFIDIVVNQGNTILRALNKVRNENIGIKGLAIEEYSALGLHRTVFKTIENCIKFMFGFNLPAVKRIKAFEHIIAGNQKTEAKGLGKVGFLLI